MFVTCSDVCLRVTWLIASVEGSMPPGKMYLWIQV